MSDALRDPLLSIKVKVDKTALAQTDAAFDSATKSAEFFENGLYKAYEPLKKIGAQLDANVKKARELAQVLLPEGALPARPPTAPSDRAAQAAREAFALSTHPAPPRPGQSLAAPDVSAFIDSRSPARRAFDDFKAKASEAATRAGEAFVSLNNKLNDVTSRIFTMRTAMLGFTAAIVGSALGHFIGGVIESGRALHDMSERTRVSVETLQVWRSFAMSVGVDAGTVETALRKLTRSMAAAARGSKLQANAFKELGVSVKNSDGSLRPIEDVLIDTGSALAALEDDSKATAIAVQVLGPAGMGLVPAFAKGADAVRKMTAEMKENVALNAEEAARLEDVGVALQRGEKKWVALRTRAVVAILPLLEMVSHAFEAVSKWVLRMSRETEILHTIWAELAAGGLARLVIMLGAWITKVGGARAALSLFGSGLRSAAVAAAEFLIPLLLIEDFLTFLAGGKSVFGRAVEEIFEGGAASAREWILKTFQEIGKVLTEDVMPAIRDIASSPFFTGALKAAGEAFLGLLNLIGLAFTSDAEKVDELGARFLRNTQAMSEAIDGVIGKVKGLFGMSGGPTITTPAPGATPEPSSGPPLGIAQAFGLGPGPTRYASSTNLPSLSAVVPAPSVPAAPRNVTINDQRKIEVNVGDSKSPGATGRAVGSAVDGVLSKDRRQTLNAVSG